MACARTFNPGKIIAIDIDEFRLNLALKLGLADFVFNPQQCDIEKEIKKLTENRGADSVIEAGGGKNTFETAWKIARPNAIVGVVAMYEENQILPLPEMYGKNLTFKTGGVDAVHCKKLLEMISKGIINTDFLITHTFQLDELEKAYKFFEAKSDNCLKTAINY